MRSAALRAPAFAALLATLAAVLSGAVAAGCQAARRPGAAPHGDSTAVDRIVASALERNAAYDRLVELCDDVGHRLSGSAALDRAIDWAVRGMEADGLANVHREAVQVPMWVRGNESLQLVEPRERRLTLLGLGGSVGTPPEGIAAEVVVVRDKAELDALDAGAVAGKIVLFNAPMPPYDPVKGSGYGETVQYRVNGAVWAAEKGAVAALVRSVTARSLMTPHTGGMRYGDAKRRIPTAAIAVEDAEQLARFAARGKRVVVRLVMEARDEGEAPSANVVAELRGRERPEEIVLVSGHLDSWDVGMGAQDDGSGCVIAMEAAALLRRLGLVPRRTIRVVLWVNEENGMAGVKGYLAAHAAELPRHVAALESDNGGFRPLGLYVDHEDAGRLKLAAGRLRRMLESCPALVALAAAGVESGESAPDVGNFKPSGIPCLGLRVEGSTYFDYHHTPADTVDKVDRGDLSRCVAVTAAAAWLLGEMPDGLAEGEVHAPASPPGVDQVPEFDRHGDARRPRRACDRGQLRDAQACEGLLMVQATPEISHLLHSELGPCSLLCLARQMSMRLERVGSAERDADQRPAQARAAGSAGWAVFHALPSSCLTAIRSPSATARTSLSLRLTSASVLPDALTNSTSRPLGS